MDVGEPKLPIRLTTADSRRIYQAPFYVRELLELQRPEPQRALTESLEDTFLKVSNTPMRLSNGLELLLPLLPEQLVDDPVIAH